MQDRPDDIHEHELRRALAAWGIYDASLAYAAVGFGDHHWTAASNAGAYTTPPPPPATSPAAPPDSPSPSPSPPLTDPDRQRWFVTVADLTAKPYCGVGVDAAAHGLRRAMDTAAYLRDREQLDFVVAPLLTRHGETLHRLDDRRGRYGVSVFAHVDGVPGRFGEALPPRESALLVDLLARLHRAAPPPMAPVPPPSSAASAELERALADLGRPWQAGPHAEPTRALLSDNITALRRRLGEFDRAVEHLARKRPERVLTHGEPHPGNTLDTTGGRLLIDWDTVGLAVPERDLWMVAANPEDLERYADATGHTPDPSAMALYRLRWDLDDVLTFTTLFRAPHVRSQDTDQSWAALNATVARLAES